jgi:hypothetical protein
MGKKNRRGCRESRLTGTLLGSRSGRGGFKDGAEVAVLRRSPRRKRYTGIRKTPRKDDGLLGCSGRTTLRRGQCDRFPVRGLSLLRNVGVVTNRSTVGTQATVSWTENRRTAMQCTSTTEVSKATKVLLRQPRMRRVEVMTRSESVIGQSSRRGDINRPPRHTTSGGQNRL